MAISTLPPGTGRSKTKTPPNRERRIGIAGLSIWPLLVTFWVSASVWLGFLLYICWSGLENFPVFCEWKAALPAGTGLLMLLVFGFVLFTLHGHGLEAPATDERSKLAKTKWHGRIRHGYGSLGETHRTRGRRSFFGTMSVIGAAAGMLSFFFVDLELSAWLIGIVFMVLALLLNRYWLK
jgi:hypothetical protein